MGSAIRHFEALRELQLGIREIILLEGFGEEQKPPQIKHA